MPQAQLLLPENSVVGPSIDAGLRHVHIILEVLLLGRRAVLVVYTVLAEPAGKMERL